jgi:hypothetical protein
MMIPDQWVFSTLADPISKLAVYPQHFKYVNGVKDVSIFLKIPVSMMSGLRDSSILKVVQLIKMLLIIFESKSHMTAPSKSTS